MDLELKAALLTYTWRKLLTRAFFPHKSHPSLGAVLYSGVSNRHINVKIWHKIGHVWVLLWHSALRIWPWHCISLGCCCGAGLILGQGTSACSNKEKKSHEKDTYYNMRAKTRQSFALSRLCWEIAGQVAPMTYQSTHVPRWPGSAMSIDSGVINKHFSKWRNFTCWRSTAVCEELWPAFSTELFFHHHPVVVHHFCPPSIPPARPSWCRVL